MFEQFLVVSERKQGLLQLCVMNFKNDSMHYSVGQEVYGGHTICDVVEEEDKYCIYIRKKDIVIPWKDFNKNMAVAIEYNIDY